MVEAKVIADSVSPDGVRLTTVQATMHRFVLAELNTHRVFSRNSASSRAISFKKQFTRVQNDPAIPVSFPAEQKGMQGGEELPFKERLLAEDVWRNAANDAATYAQQLHELGVHKSVANRLLEPFLLHTVVITSTAWENFFNQRCDDAAQPEIKVVAEAIRDAMGESEATEKDLGDWHLPYTDDLQGFDTHDLKRISAARCARVSYETQEGTRDPQADLDLFDRLMEGSNGVIHWSPLEHVATPCRDNRQFRGSVRNTSATILTEHLPKVGNLLGWMQFRAEAEAGLKETTFV